MTPKKKTMIQFMLNTLMLTNWVQIEIQRLLKLYVQINQNNFIFIFLSFLCNWKMFKV